MAGIFDNLKTRVQKVLDQVVDEAVVTAMDEIGPQIAPAVRNAYMDSAAKWYASYTPKSSYTRHYSLFNLLHVDDYRSGQPSIGWVVSDENMTREQWGRGSFNPWYQIYWAGYHGGPVGHWTDDGDFVTSHVPTHTTPIPNLFNKEVQDIQDYYSGIAANVITREINEKFYSRWNNSR